ncbi:neuronal regeneration-related protein isoform X1 [Macaca nemestrina]|uniref:neuronal regeneration-related protein isoform X1 n=2 Tax=Macaca nemestrina TaxID=9545 RepID=UPI0039B8D790
MPGRSSGWLCACDCVHVCVCTRSHRTSGPGLRGRSPPRASPRKGVGRAYPAQGQGPTWAVCKCMLRGLFVCLRAAPRRRGHHFLLRSGQAHKRKAAAARRRPLFLRCPLLQVYYYSVERRE